MGNAGGAGQGLGGAGQGRVGAGAQGACNLAFPVPVQVDTCLTTHASEAIPRRNLQNASESVGPEKKQPKVVMRQRRKNII